MLVYVLKLRPHSRPKSSSRTSLCHAWRRKRASEVDYRVPRATMLLASTHDNLTECHGMEWWTHARLVRGLRPSCRHSKAKLSASRIFENGLLTIFLWIVSVNKALMWLLFWTRRLYLIFQSKRKACVLANIFSAICEIVQQNCVMNTLYDITNSFPSVLLMFCVEKWHCY